jgi:hypothetical protein
MTPDFFVLGEMWYIVFLFSATCHEGAHALTSKLGGQVTLNPLPHIRRSPMGIVVVPILSYISAH